MTLLIMNVFHRPIEVTELSPPSHNSSQTQLGAFKCLRLTLTLPRKPEIKASLICACLTSCDLEIHPPSSPVAEDRCDKCHFTKSCSKCSKCVRRPNIVLVIVSVVSCFKLDLLICYSSQKNVKLRTGKSTSRSADHTRQRKSGESPYYPTERLANLICLNTESDTAMNLSRLTILCSPEANFALSLNYSVSRS